MKIRIPLLLAIVLTAALSILSVAAPVPDAPWTGEWIGPAQTTNNTWLCFRKTANLINVPSSVKARIAVDSKYWLWINGKLVVNEGGLKRGPTPRDTYYDEVEIGPALKRGNNCIAVLVWFWGKNGFSYNTSGKPGLVFEATGTEPEIISDPTWKMSVHPAFGDTDGRHPNYRLPEFNVGFDARRDIPGWIQLAFNDPTWKSPTVYGTPPVAPWNNLVKRPIPQWKDSGLRAYVKVETTTNKDGGQVVKGHLPYDAQVTPFLKVNAPAGQQIDIRTDDYMGGGEPSVRSVYTTRAGTQEFETPAWMNGHDVHYSAPSSVKFIDVKYRETGYNADFVGTFHCDDDKLNTLWEKSRRTLNVTMRDNYMDCPDRERAQWWGDMVNEMGETFYVFDAKRGPLLARKGILELANWQRSDHTLYSPIPSTIPADGHRKDNGSGFWNAELPPQMLASVGKYGFWNYYWYTGDKDTIAAVYPHVRDYLKVWQLDTNGLVIHRAGDWDWEDWGENIDAAVMDSAWYYLALQGAIDMAKLTDHNEDLPEWQSRLGSIRQAFNTNFWTGNEYHSHDYHGDTDDRANALAVVAGLAYADKFDKLRDVFLKHYNASPSMEKYVLEALYWMNAPDQAMQRMKKRWAHQIDSPLTTLWEMWGPDGNGAGTYNHAWSGGALTVLSEYAGGVIPDGPGFRSYGIMPQLGSLTAIQSTVPTPYGLIQLEIKRTPTLFDLRLTSPPETEAWVGIPKEEGKTILRVEMNGKKVAPQGGETGRYLFYWVKPGKYHFQAFLQ
jgi:alpha-L-rhamnosidase